MHSLVSIIIPTYNRAHIIRETLESVLVQTYANWECIIVDDGSDDNTEEVLEAYCIKDSRFQYYKRPKNRDKGANACRNYGFEMSKGDYINWLDSDDLMLPNKLEAQISFMIKNSDNLITCSWGRFEDSKKMISYVEHNSYNDFKNLNTFLESLITSKGYFPIHAYLMSKAIILKSGFWDERLLVNQDGEFMSRIFKYVNNFYCAKNTSVFYRHTSNFSTSTYNTIDKAKVAIKVWRIISQRLIKENRSYVFFMKMKLYKNIKKTFPKLIINNFLFFREIIFYNWYKNKLIYRVVKKANKLIKF